MTARIWQVYLRHGPHDPRHGQARRRPIADPLSIVGAISAPPRSSKTSMCVGEPIHRATARPLAWQSEGELKFRCQTRPKQENGGCSCKESRLSVLPRGAACKAPFREHRPVPRQRRRVPVRHETTAAGPGPVCGKQPSRHVVAVVWGAFRTNSSRSSCHPNRGHQCPFPRRPAPRPRWHRATSRACSPDQILRVHVA